MNRVGSQSASWRGLLAAVVLLLAAVAAYHNGFDGPFLFDDVQAIVKNRTIRQLWPPWAALSPPMDGAGVTGRPVANLSMAVNYAFGGMAVRGYHLMNLLLHILAALTLWGILRRTLRLPPLAVRFGADAEWFALSAALLWTVHPLLTESVVSVVQRNEILGGLFYLLTLYCFIRSRPDLAMLDSAGLDVGAALCRDGNVASRTDRGVKPLLQDGRGAARPHVWQVLAVVACLMGVASKEFVASAPVMVLLYDRIFVTGSLRAAWQRRRLFYVALAATWLPLAWLIAHNQQRSGTAGFGLGVSSWEYLLTQCRAVITYLQLSFWPHPLVFDYGRATVKTLADVWPQAALLVALATATLIGLCRGSWWGFLGAWFFALLAPSSSVVPLITQTIAEHRMYLPLAAVIVLVVAALHTWLGRRSLVAFAALAAVCGWLTVERNEDYRSELALWSDTVAKRPENVRAQISLGNVFAAQGRWAEAMPYYERALQLRPGDAEALNDLGNVLIAVGRAPEGMVHVQQALRVSPDFVEAERNLRRALLHTGRAVEAIPHYERALQLRSEDPATHNGLGAALMTVGRATEGLAQFQRALQLDPDQAETERNLGVALSTLGRIDEAVPHFAQALWLKPDYAEAEFRWAIALANANRFAEAVVHFEKAIALDPASAEAHAVYAQALARAGRPDEAAHHEREARRLDSSQAPKE